MIQWGTPLDEEEDEEEEEEVEVKKDEGRMRLTRSPSSLYRRRRGEKIFLTSNLLPSYSLQEMIFGKFVIVSCTMAVKSDTKNHPYSSLNRVFLVI